LFLARRWCVGIKNPELGSPGSPVRQSRLAGSLARRAWFVAEIVEAVGKLHDKQTAAGEINQRLRRFPERRNKR
jgi:hypothetical protein